MNNENDLSAVRREYQTDQLDEADLDSCPKSQFDRWFEQYQQQTPINATAMILSTASEQGEPSARVVLLKHYDTTGFCWYSDYQSQKGQALAANPQAELLFYWPELDRQVRIFGRVELLGRDSAQRYFSERPRGSQISAAAACQSQVVSGRQQLEQQVEVLQKRYQGGSVPCPESWGGYRLIPSRYEFWQGRESRLHDRLVYRLDSSGGWHIERLAP